MATAWALDREQETKLQLKNPANLSEDGVLHSERQLSDNKSFNAKQGMML